MLVLTRKAGQKVMIGDTITVVVNKVEGNRVTLGIEAPKDVLILRGELEKLQSKNQQENSPNKSAPTN